MYEIYVCWWFSKGVLCSRLMQLYLVRVRKLNYLKHELHSFKSMSDPEANSLRQKFATTKIIKIKQCLVKTFQKCVYVIEFSERQFWIHRVQKWAFVCHISVWFENRREHKKSLVRIFKISRSPIQRFNENGRLFMIIFEKILEVSVKYAEQTFRCVSYSGQLHKIITARVFRL